MLRTHYISDALKEEGKEVTLAGWVHETRNLGKIKFLILRDRTGLIQITSKENDTSADVHSMMEHPKETVLQVQGRITKSQIAKAGFELIPSKIVVLSKIYKKVPFEVTGKTPADIDTRLDHRHVDLRTEHTNAIFKIQHTILSAFREKCIDEGFQEIHTPSLTAAATEGGADLFRVEYFEKEAFLVQSPQLYKQLAVIGGMDRVFLIVPAFRAEKHNTSTHLNECTQMDVEIGFADHHDAMDILERVILHINKKVSEINESELKILNSTCPSIKKIPRFTYSQIVQKLNKAGVLFEWGKDFSREDEEKIRKLIPEDLYFIYDWPTKSRAFYSMPEEENKEICHSFDLMYRGTEIASGAQRIHTPDLLEQQIRFHNLNPIDFKFYIEAFMVGAPPHAGWSIGLERLLMKITNQRNIRECSLFPRDRTRLLP
ncbi:MAG: aspartate--tRNA(Asn) ligase [Candidatus Anstonellales archaeon]